MISFMFWGIKLPLIIMINGVAIAMVCFAFKELFFDKD